MKPRTRTSPGPTLYTMALACLIPATLSGAPHPFGMVHEEVGVVGDRRLPEGPAVRMLPHNIRMSLATLEPGPGIVTIEIRFFWDDLQVAVMERTSNMEFELAESPEVDRVVETYINDMLTVEVDGTRLVGTVSARGVQGAPRRDEVMWWYRVEYPVDGAPDRIYVKNRLLFNMFEDQRNIMHVTTRSGRERAYYFSWDEEDVHVPLR